MISMVLRYALIYDLRVLALTSQMMSVEAILGFSFGSNVGPEMLQAAREEVGRLNSQGYPWFL